MDEKPPKVFGRAVLWLLAIVGGIDLWHSILNRIDPPVWERDAKRVGSIVEGEWHLRLTGDSDGGRLTVSNGLEEHVYEWLDEPPWPEGQRP